MNTTNEPMPPAPVDRLVGRVVHCWRNTHSFPVSSSFIDDPIAPGVCELLIRVPSSLIPSIIEKCEAYQDPEITLAEINPPKTTNNPPSAPTPNRQTGA